MMAKISLPIGISFFIFQSMSYIINVYNKITDTQKKPFNLALYISLFPQCKFLRIDIKGTLNLSGNCNN